VQYDFLLHRNCFLLINILENGMSRVLNFHKISKLSKISKDFKKIQNDKIFKKFENFQN
jgi:hypothetical protein